MKSTTRLYLSRKEVSILLPKTSEIRKQKLDENFSMHYEQNLALFSFDKNKDGKFDVNELSDALKYFIDMEKNIALKGIKNDRILDHEDFKQIIETDPRFIKLIEHCNGDIGKAAYLLKDTLAGLVDSMTLDIKDAKLLGLRNFSTDEKGSNWLRPHFSPYVVECNIKEVDGKKVKIWRNGSKETYVTTMHNNRYTNPAYVAKCLGYLTESTWFGLGAPRYYSEELDGHDLYKCHQKWNNETYSFTFDFAKGIRAYGHTSTK